MGDVFTQLAVVFVVAIIVAYVLRLLKQPMIMGYILTGIIVGPAFMNAIHDTSAFNTFSNIGVVLLLFIIGLELNVRVIKRLGRPVFFTAGFILLAVGNLGFLLSFMFHFTMMESILVGLSLFFSSTIIIAKTLSDKKEIAKLHGQLAIGIILIDDIVATFALLFISGHAHGAGLNVGDIGFLVLKGVTTLMALYLLSNKVLPRLVKYMAKSQELLFLFAIAWGFGVAAAVSAIGFSIEVGALAAGVSLASLPYAQQIGARLKPLRDFFVVLFFISLGEGFEFSHFGQSIIPALVFSAVVVLFKPLCVMISLGLFHYTKRTSFKVGINLSQISEFSIVLIVLAHQTGMVSAQITSIITLVAIITIAFSTYLMQYDNKIYDKIEKRLSLFERATTSEIAQPIVTYPIVLFGFKKGSSKFIKTFKDMNEDFVIVDYDPEVIESLQRRKLPFLYGDVTDPELLAEIDMEQSKLIVNTILDQEANAGLVRYVRRFNKTAYIICYAHDYDEAAELYKLGASYVVLPHFVSSEQLSEFLAQHGLNHRSFDRYRSKQLAEMGRIAMVAHRATTKKDVPDSI